MDQLTVSTTLFGILLGLGVGLGTYVLILRGLIRFIVRNDLLESRLYNRSVCIGLLIGWALVFGGTRCNDMLTAGIGFLVTVTSVILILCQLFPAKDDRSSKS